MIFLSWMSVIYITKLNIYISQTCPPVCSVLYALYRETHFIYTWVVQSFKKAKYTWDSGILLVLPKPEGLSFCWKAWQEWRAAQEGGREGGREQLRVNIDEAATEMQYAYTTRHSYTHTHTRPQTFTNSKHHKSVQVMLGQITTTDSACSTLSSKNRDSLSAARDGMLSRWLRDNVLYTETHLRRLMF